MHFYFKKSKMKIVFRGSKSYTCILFYLFLFSYLNAQTTQTITLEEAIEKGIAHSKMLKTSALKVNLSKIKYKELWNLQIPNFNLNAGYTRLSDNVQPFVVRFPSGESTLNPQILNQYNLRASAQQVVFSGFRAMKTLELNQYLNTAMELDYEKDKNEAKLNIANAYFSHKKLLISRSLIQENLKLIESRLKDVKNLAAQGVVLQNDVLKVELVQNATLNNQIDLENNIDISNYNLAKLLGLSEVTPIEPTTQEFLENEKNQATEKKLRPELQAQQLRVAAAEKNIQIAKGAYYPTVTVGGNYYYNRPNQRVFPQMDEFKDTWDLGLNVSYNLSSIYTNKFQVEEAKLNLVQNNTSLELLNENIEIETYSALNSFKATKQKLEIFAKSVSQYAENQRVVKNRFDNNVATITDLMEADVSYLQAKLNVQLAKIDICLAWAKYQKALGK